MIRLGACDLVDQLAESYTRVDEQAPFRWSCRNGINTKTLTEECEHHWG